MPFGREEKTSGPHSFWMSKADLPPAWANITGDTEGEQHPLTMLAEDEVTKANLEATRLGVLKQQPSEPKERDPTGSNP